jgi:hypothetical protein
MFKNGVLRRMSGLRRDDMMGGWRKLLKKSFFICALCQA